MGHAFSTAPAAIVRWADLTMPASSNSVSAKSPHSDGCETAGSEEVSSACQRKKAVQSVGACITASIVTPSGQMIERVNASSSEATGSTRTSVTMGLADAPCCSSLAVST
eukprot:6930528-Prymnesium_polylepis.3